MLLSRYKDIHYVNCLHWQDGIKLINKAMEKRSEEKDWAVWLSIYPNMDKDTFIPFDRFRGKKTESRPRIKQTTEEIIAKAEEIRLIHQGKHEGVKSPPPES